MIDTGKVQGRRQLSFADLDAVAADVDALVAAENAGKLKRLGNWSLGQACGHVAAFIDYAFDGYPKELSSPPWYIKFLVKFKRNDFLNGKLPAGIKIPRIEGGTTGIEPVSTQEGVARLKRSIDRLKAKPPGIPNPIFGPLTHTEWQSMHRGHAQLHLSFFVVG